MTKKKGSQSQTEHELEFLQDQLYDLREEFHSVTTYLSMIDPEWSDKVDAAGEETLEEMVDDQRMREHFGLPPADSIITALNAQPNLMQRVRWWIRKSR